MAKDIQMNLVDLNGNYEAMYPITKQKLVIDLLNNDTKELMGLDSTATANDAFKKTYLSSILNDKAMVELTFTDSVTRVPLSGIRVSCDLFCDSAGTDMTYYTTNENGKILGFVSNVNPTISITNYADITDFSAQLDVPKLGESYAFSFMLETHDFRKYETSSQVRFSGNVESIDVTVVGGGGGGGGSAYNDPHYGGGGGGGGYCITKESADFVAYNLYSMTIGAGGVGGAYNNNGSNGGASSFLSFTVNGGNGGTGAKYEFAAGGTGNGNGGKGGYANENSSQTVKAVAGGRGSTLGYSSFTGTILYGGGGGGGGAYHVVRGEYNEGVGNSTPTASAGGSSNGAGGSGGYSSSYIDNWGDHMAAPHGGDSGKVGCVAIRMHLKSNGY